MTDLQPCAASMADCAGNKHAWSARLGIRLGMLVVSMLLFILAGCSQAPVQPTASPTGTPGLSTRPDGTLVWQRGKAQWVSTTWDSLPGWLNDQAAQAWPALWRSCQRPSLDWRALCQQVSALGMQWGEQVGDTTVQMWLQSHLAPWRVESLEGETTGLLTGYVEPIIEARRQADARFRYPLYRPPATLGQRKPWYSRAEIDTLPEAQAALAGRALAYVADPLDALLIQVQGSTRLVLLDEWRTNGQPMTIRLSFAGHNDHPYQSVARWLIDQGEISADQASWGAIKAWAARHPERLTAMLHANPRVIFFRESALLDEHIGPVGAQGVPLSPMRSIAVDRESIPYGSLVWLDSVWPVRAGVANTPLQRLVLAQDTGSAIVGAVRADFFWGWGAEALTQAGRTKQALQLWVLWPRQDLPAR